MSIPKFPALFISQSDRNNFTYPKQPPVFDSHGTIDFETDFLNNFSITR